MPDFYDGTRQVTVSVNRFARSLGFSKLYSCVITRKRNATNVE
ncbi:hypothetical protein HanRHA438_Chr04g0151711 [Helianthus annuus]|uniref:Uncharacterized protein n=1 Tax=Helianthus annuus TaxID=4232 RepID=A0A9K3J402_HELAN|nr:hypothetical protein HanXRQr2_Chr04g0140281 [Helianthus annuus]KAJ0595170.1 hypothetical protein HanHA89_Chr04g0128421 [Helianthus annuus]KAJ0924727.1 hypothetical protein HanRHA438_Chr04g0151711 [Helianthus annuus]